MINVTVINVTAFGVMADAKKEVKPEKHMYTFKVNTYGDNIITVFNLKAFYLQDLHGHNVGDHWESNSL